MTLPNSLMIFAAGLGSRMGELTRDRAKPMIEVAGKPLIEHALAQAKPLPDLNIVANIHYKPDRLRNYLSARGVAISDETDRRLETGGGLRKALPLLGQGPVFTLNADAVWEGPSPLEILMDEWDGDRMSALLLCTPQEKARAYRGKGDFILLSDGQGKRGPDLVYTGASITDPTGINAIPETAFSLNVLWNSAIERNRLFIAVYTGEWCDVGHPQGLEEAEAMLQAGNVSPALPS